MQPSPRPVVLVAEDDPLNRELYREILESLDAEVIEVVDGIAALASVRERRPHVIVMDVRLPGLSGREVVGVLKRDPEFSGIPVVAVTGLVTDEDTQLNQACGFDVIVRKPVNIKTFLELIGGILDTRERCTA